MQVEALKSGETLRSTGQRVEMTEEERKALKSAVVWGGVGIAAIVALGAVQVFAINPWIVKAFKPEWSYGRRLGASLAFGIVSGTLVSLARAASGKEENTNITLNAPGAGVTSTPAPSTAAATK